MSVAGRVRASSQARHRVGQVSGQRRNFDFGGAEGIDFVDPRLIRAAQARRTERGARAASGALGLWE